MSYFSCLNVGIFYHGKLQEIQLKYNGLSSRRFCHPQLVILLLFNIFCGYSTDELGHHCQLDEGQTLNWCKRLLFQK